MITSMKTFCLEIRMQKNMKLIVSIFIVQVLNIPPSFHKYLCDNCLSASIERWLQKQVCLWANISNSEVITPQKSSISVLMMNKAI